MEAASIATADAARAHFRNQHYLVLPDLLEEPLLSVANQYVLRRCARGGELSGDDGQVAGAVSCHGDPLMDAILELVQPVVENCTGLTLVPSYTYFRQYRNGCRLERHLDRRECEISVSLTLGYQCEEPWPIFLALPAGDLEAELGPGDGLVYRGRQHAHWREKFCGVYHNQVFLHYMIHDGGEPGEPGRQAPP